MKALFVVLAMLSFSAFGYEINPGNAKLPIEVQDAIRASFDHECGSVTRNVKTLVLEKLNVTRTSIDQGYMDDNYDLSFVIITDWSETNRPDKLLIKVVLPIQERSGRFDPYVTDFQTIYGSDGDAICNN